MTAALSRSLPGAEVDRVDVLLRDDGKNRRAWFGLTYGRGSGLVVDRALLRVAHPCCDKPPSECEADHKVPHSKGGPTTFVNGQGACDGHNVAKGNKDPTDTDDP
jgi:5-methylcytosine-specific restriction endonuclease McrA